MSIQTVEDLELTPNYSDFFIKNVVPDLENFCTLSHQEKLKKYSFMLQKQYTTSTNPEISEIYVKRILAAKIPKLIKENETETSTNSALFTDSDIHAVKYLAGAVLRWGLNKFNSKERSWSREQVDVENDHLF